MSLSLSLSSSDLHVCLLRFNVLFTPCLKVEAIAGWMESVAKTLPKRGYEQACGIWNGHDYIPILRQMGITVMTFEIILVSTIPLTV